MMINGSNCKNKTFGGNRRAFRHLAEQARYNRVEEPKYLDSQHGVMVKALEQKLGDPGSNLHLAMKLSVALASHSLLT